MSPAFCTGLVACLLALGGCNDAPRAATGESPPPPPAAPSPEPAKPSAQAAAGANKACNMLVQADFEAVGLSHGKAKPESNMAGGGCTWEPVLGNGGFLHFEFLSASSYDKRKERAGEKAVAVQGLGDGAFVSKALVGHAIHVKKGDTSFRIDGNAQLTPEKLEPLARAAMGRL